MAESKKKLESMLHRGSRKHPKSNQPHYQAVSKWKETKSKEVKRQRALLRQAEREKRTAQGQLERLDTLLGEGVGATRERARLLAVIEAARQTPVHKQPSIVPPEEKKKKPKKKDQKEKKSTTP